MYYEAPPSKECLLSTSGPHSKKKVSFFTVQSGDRTHVYLGCWSQKCDPRCYPVPATLPEPAAPKKPKPEPFWVYQSDSVLKECAGLDVTKSDCCVAKIRELFGPHTYSVPDIIAMLEGVTEPCCAHYRDHVKEMALRLDPPLDPNVLVMDLPEYDEICPCCNRDRANCDVTRDVAFAMQANYFGGFEAFQTWLHKGVEELQAKQRKD
jgi:hypothetical protein